MNDERPFRFFDNREKYLLFVTTCSEKWAIGQRIGAEFEALRPEPPALRVFDAGTGDGTVMASALRQLHGHFPTMPFLVVGKEISLEDVRLTLEKLPDRFSEHPQTVVALTNLSYREAPWLRPADADARSRVNWREFALEGHTAHEFDRQIADLRPVLADWWKVRTSRATGNPVYVEPSVIVLYRSDHRFTLDAVIPRPDTPVGGYDLVIAAQPFRARHTAEHKVRLVLEPLAASLATGGRMITIQSTGQDPGMEIIRRVWPGEEPFQTPGTGDRAGAARAARIRLPGARFQHRQRIAQLLPLFAARDAERGHRETSAPRPGSRRGTRRSTSPRSMTTASPARCRTAPISTRRRGRRPPRRAVVRRRVVRGWCGGSERRLHSRSRPGGPATRLPADLSGEKIHDFRMAGVLPITGRSAGALPHTDPDSACSRSAMSSSELSMPTETRSRFSGTTLCGPSTVARCSIRLSTPPSEGRGHEEPGAGRDPLRGLRVAGDEQGQHRAEAVGHLALRDRVSRVGPEPRVEHRVDLRVAFEVPGDGHRVSRPGARSARAGCASRAAAARTRMRRARSPSGCGRASRPPSARRRSGSRALRR